MVNMQKLTQKSMTGWKQALVENYGPIQTFPQSLFGRVDKYPARVFSKVYRNIQHYFCVFLGGSSNKTRWPISERWGGCVCVCWWGEGRVEKHIALSQSENQNLVSEADYSENNPKSHVRYPLICTPKVCKFSRECYQNATNASTSLTLIQTE